MIDINQIYKMLNWKNPLEVQLKGICLARDIKDLSFLIKPPADSSVWEQCAKILCEKSNGELEPYLEKLFEWIEDLNWPGASDIYERLKKFCRDKKTGRVLTSKMQENIMDIFNSNKTVKN